MIRTTNTLHIVRTLLFFPAVCFVFFLPYACSRRNQDPPSPIPCVRPELFEIYSVGKKRDAQHSVEFEDSLGNAWYRTADPVLDLCDLDFAYTITDRNRNDGSFVVLMLIKPSHRQRLRSWSSERIGEHAAKFYQGKLVQIDEVRAPLESQVGMGGFPSMEAATKVAELIKNGGIPVSKKDSKIPVNKGQ